MIFWYSTSTFEITEGLARPAPASGREKHGFNQSPVIIQYWPCSFSNLNLVVIDLP
jgi:hypothetical protein